MKMRLLLIAFVLFIQGCSTFRIGDLHSHSSAFSSDNESFSYSENTPIIVKFYTNYGSDKDSRTINSKKMALETIKKGFPENQVGYSKDYSSLPSEYLEIYVIEDIAIQSREGDLLFLEFLTKLLFVFSGSLLPALDLKMEHIVKINKINEGNKVESHSYSQKSQRILSTLSLPIAPLFTINDAISATTEDSIKEYLANEI